MLIRQPSGSYSLVDPGSTNGTTLNDNADPVGVNVPVPLADGDRIHLGAWTTITIHSQAFYVAVAGQFRARRDRRGLANAFMS